MVGLGLEALEPDPIYLAAAGEPWKVLEQGHAPARIVQEDQVSWARPWQGHLPGWGCPGWDSGEPSEGWEARGTRLGVTVAQPGDSFFL